MWTPSGIIKMFFIVIFFVLTLSWRRSLSYRNQSIDLQSKSLGWFLYDRDFRHKKVKWVNFSAWFTHSSTRVKILSDILKNSIHIVLKCMILFFKSINVEGAPKLQPKIIFVSAGKIDENKTNINQFHRHKKQSKTNLRSQQWFCKKTAFN